jgi:hypothetical protein
MCLCGYSKICRPILWYLTGWNAAKTLTIAIKLSYKLWKAVATLEVASTGKIFKSLETGEVYEKRTTNEDSDKL